jgi:hypothetical protein
MTESKETKYLVAQPLTGYMWPFDVPTRLWHSLWVRTTPELPTGDNAFWRWALSGREIEDLKRVPWWITPECSADDSALSKRQHRAVEIVRYTRLAIQLVAPVGCNESTIVISGPNRVSTVHPRPMPSTPWGRINGYENASLDEIRRVVRGVNSVLRFRVPRLINSLNFLELGFGAENEYISTFLWVSGLDAVLMAGTPQNFRQRLINVLGEKSFVLPKVDPGGQPKYRVGEIAEDVYELRSKIAHGSLIPKKFLAQVRLKNVNEKNIESYAPATQYLHIVRECALFLLIGVMKKIFLEDFAKVANSTGLWRTKLNNPW